MVRCMILKRKQKWNSVPGSTMKTSWKSSWKQLDSLRGDRNIYLKFKNTIPKAAELYFDETFFDSHGNYCQTL